MKSFLTSHDEKITEKAFSRSLCVSVLSILLCLILLCSMTYAWFTDGTSSGGNTLTSASFGLEKPQVVQADDASVNIEVLPGENGVWRCTLPNKEEKYTVILTLDADSTAKGHCVVSINGKDQKTAAIIGDRTVNREGYPENSSPFTFTIQTTENDTVVEFRPVWGVVAEPDIKMGAPCSVADWGTSSADQNGEAAS